MQDLGITQRKPLHSCVATSWQIQTTEYRDVARLGNQSPTPCKNIKTQQACNAAPLHAHATPGGGVQTAATLTRPGTPRGFGTRGVSHEGQRIPTVQTGRAAPFRRFPRSSWRVVTNLPICFGASSSTPRECSAPPRRRRATNRLAQREDILNSFEGAFIAIIARSRIRSAAPSDAARGAFKRHAVGLTPLRHVDQ